ncbi:5-methyltetrahydropteroyltriglutamate--homocysteine methyltransferase [Bordetella hinzii]|uniref:5-methyltetrahydropteroyltriglutamate-- homocysteine methyltransferase n=1 Tax=Bordetella hinzii TaxID=103855 RepID=UPI001C02DB9D|nr:5-methyltetrahydropteroyltriglutamate--homocysteine methyltransferase [Bordetella hinzii]QWF36965.1 5-methyltetrahydropteroyltriglutamate--homocysteine methyltransferase [Bordetella hinzii]QWF41509.1 5-methyltetrahydropteroyltriglutamate--homocysteine methyltransferase [Bordetella hinzii]QWF46050.1 5-methyltetrahydropteroyltriglutamate--homocysteine methyltransferase [Bordetella hinzii]QWF50589.1 5-methyltetrahydropteroyltriglutamate--homocysteine methyltransferase [Bordetella hinzii]QWF551
MQAVSRHEHSPDVSFDGGDLDCGNGLLLLIRKHIDPLPRGGLLEILSREISVDEDLPAWCRLTGNELVSWTKQDGQRSFLVCKGALAERGAGAPAPAPRPAGRGPAERGPAERGPAEPRQAPRQRIAAPPLPPLAVTGMGSWPRPRWMIEAMHAHVQGRLPEAAFQETADDAVRLAIAAQEKAGVDMITDGEQRRDSYASFVASRLDNCQLIPLTDLLPLVDDPEAFAAELRALDIPAGEVRHPAVFGRLARSRPLVAHEVDFARSVTGKPVKVALPGPYLLTRTMWMECISDRAYDSRETLAADIVRVLREELAELLDAGAALVQLDEPVLSEVVFSGAKNKRSFMCGALSESLAPEQELAFARDLLNAVLDGMPQERTALHVCRGNWTPDESVALSGDYAPLLPTLAQVRVGAYLLEMCTPRAGDVAMLKALPDHARIGIGVVNQKDPAIESETAVAARIERGVGLFGRDRLLLHPDCGFATFADNPICSAGIAQQKLAVIAQAAGRFAR